MATVAACCRRLSCRASPPCRQRRWATPSAAASVPSGTTSGAAELIPASTSQQAPRFYVPTPLAAATAGAVLRLPPEEARHATKTLRLRQGDRLELCDGRGFVALAELAGVDKSGAVVSTLQPPLQVPQVGWQWEVACACGSLKGGRSDWLVEKCAELGAAAFTPLLTQRSPTIGSGGGGTDDDKHSGKRSGRRRGDNAEVEDDAEWAGQGGSGSGRGGRWSRVATAAMKQCLRPHAMHIGAPCTVPQLCERIAAADTAALVAIAGAPLLHEVAAQLHPGSQHGILCVGPEGDWTPEELEALVAAGAQPVGLGDLRLRAETAAVALLSYVRLHLAG